MALNALHFTPASSMQNMSNTMRNINAEDRRGSLHKRQNKSIHSTLFLHEGHISISGPARYRISNRISPSHYDPACIRD
jgi:hypothetical protein